MRGSTWTRRCGARKAPHRRPCLDRFMRQLGCTSAVAQCGQEVEEMWPVGLEGTGLAYIEYDQNTLGQSTDRGETTHRLRCGRGEPAASGTLRRRCDGADSELLEPRCHVFEGIGHRCGCNEDRGLRGARRTAVWRDKSRENYELGRYAVGRGLPAPRSGHEIVGETDAPGAVIAREGEERRAKG